MKKIVSLKMLVISALILAIIGVNASVFATDGVFETNTAATTTDANVATASEYDGVNTIPVDSNYVATENTTTTDNTSTGLDSNAAYNTVDEEDTIPQTGINDYYIGIVLVVLVVASIYTYKKMRDYKNV